MKTHLIKIFGKSVQDSWNQERKYEKTVILNYFKKMNIPLEAEVHHEHDYVIRFS